MWRNITGRLEENAQPGLPFPSSIISPCKGLALYTVGHALKCSQELPEKLSPAFPIILPAKCSPLPSNIYSKIGSCILNWTYDPYLVAVLNPMTSVWHKKWPNFKIQFVAFAAGSRGYYRHLLRMELGNFLVIGCKEWWAEYNKWTHHISKLKKDHTNNQKK